MKTQTLSWLLAACVALALLGCSQPETKTAGQPGVEQAVSDAVDAYIYGYPLVTMDMTRKQFKPMYATYDG